MLLLLGLLGPLNAADVVINELLVNPAGTDAGSEWIELFNAGTGLVDLSGWSIEWGTSDYGDSQIIGGAALGPGDFIVLGGALVAEADMEATFSFGNAGSNSDAARLLDAFDVVVDTVVYGSPNTDLWLDDAGEIAESLAPGVGSGDSLARLSDGLDSDLNGDDFIGSAHPTPGMSNTSVVDTDSGEPTTDDTGGASCSGSNSIKINEFLANPDGSDDGYEWVELYNASDDTVNLGGWVLQSATSGSFSNIVAFFPGLEMAPGEHLLVGDEMVVEADVLASLNLGNAGSNADAIRLVDCEDNVADTVIYGSPNEDEWTDDNGFIATSLAAKPGNTQSLARVSDGYDTNACGLDFVISDAPTPDASNPDIVPEECEPGGEVKINEFMPDPGGVDTDAEWVELYNAGSEMAVLAGWEIAWGKNGTYSGSIRFAGETNLAPGAFLLVGGALVEDIDVAAGFDMGNAGSNSDAVQLVDCEGDVVDTVIYGSPNDEGWVDDSGAFATSLASSPGGDESLARVIDGGDTDESGADFALTDMPTPGGTNDSVSPEDCVAGTGEDIKINEILPNPESTDAEGEFIELVNTGDETVSLEGWGLESATSAWADKVDFEFPAGSTIAPGNFVVVGGAEVPEADHYIDDDNTITLGNVSKSPDGVRLLDCTGVVQDTVLYGDPSDILEDIEITDDLGAQTIGTMPEENLALGRDPDGVDTDDNAVDLFTNMPPSPGESNVRGSGGDGDLSAGCGCGGKTEGPGSSDAPVAEAHASAALIAGLLALVALRRRDDEFDA